MKFFGWIEEIRDLGHFKFIVLHTVNGDYQVTCKEGITINFKELSNLTRQSAIEVEGELQEKPISKLGREIVAREVKVISLSEPILPLDPSGKTKVNLDTRLNFRFLDFRNKKTLAVIKIQNTILECFRNFFRKEGFIEIQPPILISSASEGGSELFSLKYFEKEAYLAQSPQLYKQMAAISLEKVFCIVPIFRAEKHDTQYHLNEVRSMDIEVAFSDYNIAMNYLEKFFVYCLENIVKNNENELKVLNTQLKLPEIPFIKITYEEAVEFLNIEFGSDIKRNDEEKLCEKFGEAIFLIDFPKSLRPFYTMPKDEKVTYSFDFLYKGLELASGAQRVHIPELLEKRILEFGLKIENFKDYINAFKYGAPPHAGWAIGLERMTMKICNLENIREAAMWPRDRYRLTP
ncbi:MAG: aspartate--tRNA(Asn) ligase [Candidatus Aenigmarchaeota archaeon]|nr:aspartate--tRNA(Asn) ligase [Candidatus Aenigmarchaeota archaeon]MDW8149604.1 aspartate--tRNA(Asn) ligase [Candidatus Aenigmarchaeota archaeon]